jgi:hypothetical protein
VEGKLLLGSLANLLLDRVLRQGGGFRDPPSAGVTRLWRGAEALYAFGLLRDVDVMRRRQPNQSQAWQNLKTAIFAIKHLSELEKQQ